MNPYYDTKNGILKSLDSLSDFYKMTKDRQEAGYKRRERLSEWIVLGRYYLDTCGNCMLASDFHADEEIPELQKVYTRDGFWDYVYQYDLRTKPDLITKEERATPGFDDFDDKNRHRSHGTSISFSMNINIPYPGKVCPICARGWNMENIFDLVARGENLENTSNTWYPLISEGWTIAKVKEHYSSFVDARYYLGNESFLRNDRYIDLTPWKPEYPDSHKNKYGWVGVKEGIDDSYVLQEGDELDFNCLVYKHKNCQKIELNQKVETQLKKAFAEAGWTPAWFKAIPNEYGSESYRGSWYEVTTPYGLVEVGWRKRVIKLSFTHPSVNFTKILSDGVNEDVTKSSDMVHCWNYEALRENLEAMLELVGASSLPKALPGHSRIGPAHPDMLSTALG